MVMNQARLQNKGRHLLWTLSMKSVKTSISTIDYLLFGEQHFSTVVVKKTICFNWLGIFVLGQSKSGSFWMKTVRNPLQIQFKLLCVCLDQGSNIFAAQDFWYTKQRKGETVDSFLRGLKKTY